MAAFPHLDGNSVSALLENFMHSSSPEWVISHLWRENKRDVRGPGGEVSPPVTGMGGMGRQQYPSLLDLQMPIYCARWGSAQAQGIAKQAPGLESRK